MLELDVLGGQLVFGLLGGLGYLLGVQGGVVTPQRAGLLLAGTAALAVKVRIILDGGLEKILE